MRFRIPLPHAGRGNRLDAVLKQERIAAYLIRHYATVVNNLLFWLLTVRLAAYCDVNVERRLLTILRLQSHSGDKPVYSSSKQGVPRTGLEY